MGEEDGERFRRDVFERLMEVKFAEERIGAGKVEWVVVDRQSLRSISEKLDAVLYEMLLDEGAGFANVMISVDGEGAEARADFREYGCEVFDGVGSAVDKVAGECDKVGLETGRRFRCAGEKGEGRERFAVKVGELDDTESLEGGREVCEGDGDFADAEGLGFEEARISDGTDG